MSPRLLAVVPFPGMENTERREERLALRFEKLQYLMAGKRGWRRDRTEQPDPLEVRGELHCRKREHAEGQSLQGRRRRTETAHWI